MSSRLIAGAPSKPPKDAKVKELFVEEQKITKLVNARNENLHAALAGDALWLCRCAWGMRWVEGREGERRRGTLHTVSSGAQLGVVKPPADDFVVTRKSKKTLGDLKAAIQGGALPAKKTQ